MYACRRSRERNGVTEYFLLPDVTYSKAYTVVMTELESHHTIADDSTVRLHIASCSLRQCKEMREHAE